MLPSAGVKIAEVAFVAFVTITGGPVTAAPLKNHNQEIASLLTSLKVAERFRGVPAEVCPPLEEGIWAQVGGVFLTKVHVLEVTPEVEETSAFKRFDPALISVLVTVLEELVPARSIPFKVQATRQVEVVVVTE